MCCKGNVIFKKGNLLINNTFGGGKGERGKGGRGNGGRGDEEESTRNLLRLQRVRLKNAFQIKSKEIINF